MHSISKLIILILTVLVFKANGQEIKAIDSISLKRNLSVLTKLNGRQTGSIDDIKASQFIAAQFKKNGLISPSNLKQEYFQQVPITKDSLINVRISLDDSLCELYKDFSFIAFPAFKNVKDSSDEIVFAGYGIVEKNYDDYLNVDVKGKVVLVLAGEPRDTNGNSIITGSKNLSDWSKKTEKKLLLAKEKGAIAVLKIADNIESQFPIWQRHYSVPFISPKNEYPLDSLMPQLFITPRFAERILFTSHFSMKSWKEINIKTLKGNPVTVRRKISLDWNILRKTTYAQNIIGYIEGTSKKDECVIIIAHHDHIGQKFSETYFGADDNASGSSALIELSKTISVTKKKNKLLRSIIFLSTTGEEHNLIGSYYYVSNPLFPLQKTYAIINLDMIGRIDSLHQNSQDYVNLICSDSSEIGLKETVEKANLLQELYLDYRYNDVKDSHHFAYRSDQFPFIKKKVPALFFFDGLPKEYHAPGDTEEKINYYILQKRTQLAFLTIWLLANKE